MRDDVRWRIAADIRAFGQHVIGVARSSDDPPNVRPFSYTIGNHGVGLPELLLIGGVGDLYTEILNILGEMQRERGRTLDDGELVDFSARLPARIGATDRRGLGEYAVQAGVFYGEWDITVRQIILPDGNGRYPDDPDCLPPYSDQPILSPSRGSAAPERAPG